MINKIKFNTVHTNNHKSNTCNNIVFDNGINNADLYMNSEKVNTMSPDKCNKTDNNFYKDNVINKLSSRTKEMPILMSRVFGAINGYLSGNISREFFVKVYQNETVPLYKRIEYGENNKLFKTVYKPEISTIKEVSEITSSYSDNKISEKEMDNRIEKSVENYINTEIKRKLNFII